MGLGNTNSYGNKKSNFNWQKRMLQMEALQEDSLKQIAANTASGTWVDKQVPVGAINGVNTVFTLTNIPTAGSDYVFLSGQLQAGSGVDYTLVGNVITFNIAPNIGEQLFVSYRY